MWPRLIKKLYLSPKTLQHGKAFKILIPSGSIPCSDENSPTYSEAKKEQKRTK